MHFNPVRPVPDPKAHSDLGQAVYMRMHVREEYYSRRKALLDELAADTAIKPFRSNSFLIVTSL